MKFLILSAIALSTQVLWAANAPTKINLYTLDSKFITVNNKDQAVVLNNLNKALKQMSGGALDLPASIGLIIPQTYDSPFFDPMALTLVAPYQMVIDGRSKNPVFTRGVELHEFGHAIFNENMEFVLKKNPALLKRWTNAKKIIKKTASDKAKLLKKDLLSEMLAKKIEATKAKPSSPIMVEFEELQLTLQDEEAKLMSTYYSNQQILEEMGELFQALTPYNEFFADIVSVVITEDPQSVANALHFSNYKIPYEDRSFERRRSKRPQDGTPHNFYSLSRNYIYKYYLSNPIYKAKGKAWLIRKGLESVACGINNQEKLVEKLTVQAEELLKKNPKFNVERFAIEKMNDGLDVCIDQVFQ
jgi:hypothetical protein